MEIKELKLRGMKPSRSNNTKKNFEAEEVNTRPELPENQNIEERGDEELMFPWNFPHDA